MRLENRRRRTIVEGFHARFLVTQLTWTFALVLVFAIVIFGPTTRDLMSGTDAERLRAATRFLELHAVFWPALGALLVGLVTLNVTLSHRVAGPLYRFRVVFDAVSEGHLWVSATIRSRDYPTAEADALARMLATLRSRIAAAKFANLAAMDAVDRLASSDQSSELLAGIHVAVRRTADTLEVFQIERLSAPTAGCAVDEPSSRESQRPRHSRAGFTLVEILLVVSIIGIVSAMALPAYTGVLDVARVTRAIGDIRAVDSAIQLHQAINGCFPSSLADMGHGDLRDPWGNAYVYQVLESGGGGKGKGKGGGKGACLACNGGCVGTGQARKDHNLVPINSDFDFYSMGKDKKTASPLTAQPSRDDVVRGSNGGFIGLGRDY